jgi:hypothetical protein
MILDILNYVNESSGFPDDERRVAFMATLL